MKATEQYFPVVLFIMLYKVVLTFERVLVRMMYFSVSDTGKLVKRNSEFSQQESNLRLSVYYGWDALLTELQETCGSLGH